MNLTLGGAVKGVELSDNGGENLEPKPRREALNFDSQRAQAIKSLLISNLSPESPVLYLHGETTEPLIGEDYNYDLEAYLSDLAVEFETFDIILRFNAADNRFSLGAEGMSMALEKELKAEVKSPGNNRNLIGELLDSSSVNPPGSVALFLNLARELSAKVGDSKLTKGILFVVDNAEHLFPGSDFVSTQDEKSRQAAQIRDLKRQLADTSHLGINNQLILIDRSGNGPKESVSPELNPVAVPPLDTLDVERIFSRHGFTYAHDLQRLTAGLTASVLNATLSKADAKADLAKILIKERERQVEAMSGGLISCSYEPFGDHMMAFNPGEQEVYEQIAGVYEENPAALSNGILLMGPPGTGKTVRPRWVASRLGVPYLQVKDMGVDGLRGKKGQKLQTIFDVAKRVAPCVLDFDEVNKKFPNTEKAVMTHEDDADTEGVLQSSIGSDSMKDVLIMGSCNAVNEMSSAMLRNGRFGTKLAVLPPEGEAEKIDVFQKVKNQIPGFEEITLEDSFIGIVLQEMSDYATGADYKSVLEGALLLMQTRSLSIQEAILQAAKNIDIKAHEMFAHYVELAKANHSSVVGAYWENQTDSEPAPNDPRLDRLIRYEVDLQARHAAVSKQIKGLESRSGTLRDEITALEANVRELEAAKAAATEDKTQTITALEEREAELSTAIEGHADIQQELAQLEAARAELKTAQSDIEAQRQGVATRVSDLKDKEQGLTRRSILHYLGLGGGVLALGPLAYCSFNAGIGESISISDKGWEEIERRKQSMLERLKLMSDSGEAELFKPVTIQGRVFSPMFPSVGSSAWLHGERRYGLVHELNSQYRLFVSLYYEPPHNFLVGYDINKQDGRGWNWEVPTKRDFMEVEEFQAWLEKELDRTQI